VPHENSLKGHRKKRGRHPGALLSAKPFYATHSGAAYAGDALALIKQVPSHSVNAIITSPPYALHFKKSYGNPNQAEYVDWFLGFAEEFRRVQHLPLVALALYSVQSQQERLPKWQ
jgi:hypothetical protein